MKCFFIGERAERGFPVLRRDPEPHVPLGHSEAGYAYLPLGQSISHAMVDLDPDIRLRLDRADVVPTQRGLQLVRERNHWDRRALVLLATSAGEGGILTLTARSYDEETRNGRIVPSFHAFPPPGVTVVEDDITMLQNMTVPTSDTDPVVLQERLLVLTPGAGFRVRRTGDLSGAPPEFIVSWTGVHIRSRPIPYRASP